jgi:hypothetical protein
MDLAQLEATPSWEWPEDARNRILATLQDAASDTETRMLAAYLAGDAAVVDDEMAGALLNAVADPKAAELLRAQAAIALGPALEHADIMGFDDEEEILISEDRFEAIQKRLKSVFDDPQTPKEVRRRVLEASVRAPMGWHAQAVRQAFASQDDQWRLTAVFGMQYIEGFETEILACLDDPDPEIHLEAVTAAGSWELEAAWDHVAALVRGAQTAKDLRLAAMIRPEQVQALFDGVLGHEDEEIGEAVREALAMAEAILEGDDDDPDEDQD